MRSLKGYLLILLLLLLSVQSLLANDTAESPLRLLVLGDSLSAGYGLPAEDAFPAQLEAALKSTGYNVDVINAGVSGDTSAGGLSRLSWSLADNPELVIVELGGNDALRGLPPEETLANLDEILARLVKRKVSVILAGMKAPRNMGSEYAGKFDRIYPHLAEKHGIALYPFFLDGVALNPALNLPDGIHPNTEGVGIIVNKILPVVQSEIDTLRK